MATAVAQGLDTVYFTVSGPTEIAETTPVADTDALPVIVLHTPPVTLSLSVCAVPLHMMPDVPVITPALIVDGYTVMTVVVESALQLVTFLYFTVILPAPLPIIKPVDTLSDATKMLPVVLQVPPTAVSVSVICPPTQREGPPDIADTQALVSMRTTRYA